MVRRWLAVLVVLLALAACADAASSPPSDGDPEDEATLGLPGPASSPEDHEEGTVLRALHDDGRFDVLVALVEDRLLETFRRYFRQRSWPNTLLAPTDEAFRRLDRATREALLDDDGLLNTVMRYHIIGDAPLERSELGGRHLTPAGWLEITRDRGEVFAAGVPIEDETIDVGGSNDAVIHVVEELILPCADPVVQRDLDTCTG